MLPSRHEVRSARSAPPRGRILALAAGGLALAHLVASASFAAPTAPAVAVTRVTQVDAASAPMPGSATRGAPSAPPPPAEITAAMRAEIERVVARGRQAPVSAKASAYALATAATRCATFDAQRYCLGLGWTTSTEEDAAARLAAASAPRATRSAPETTGDLDATAALRRLARLSPRDRERLERAELTAAARSVAKVWLIRHEIQGMPLPDDFVARHPEAAAAARTRPHRHPTSFRILSEKQVRPQGRTYYCGPAAMQMIGWGWRDRRQGQALWADKLRTTSAGTAITDMVRVVNHNTGYDGEDHAGPYIVLDISDFAYRQWWRLMKRHLHTYRAPVVLHPILLEKFFPYLDDDASGHFQVGRGYRRTSGGQKLLGYFEPWDQSEFDPTEPRIARSQWQSAYKSYRANQEHFQHNLGV